MSLQRIHWEDLSESLRGAIQDQAGPVLKAQTVPEGLNSEIAVFQHTSTGKVFIKGLRSDHPRVWTQQMEAMISPYVAQVSPRLLWHIETDGWNVLAFEHIAGRHADYSPESEDLPKVVEAIRLLGEIRCPNLPLKRAEQRWAPYMDDTSALRGDALLHTDVNPLNVLINGTARIIDWAWPTRGAAWIEPACFVLRLMAAGHTPEEAEAWAQQASSWDLTPEKDIDAFSAASARVWAEIAQADPQPWKKNLAVMADQWMCYRLS
ncbi:MAG: aminoglycoside phosphotransferase [Actinomycetota bacterium]